MNTWTSSLLCSLLLLSAPLKADAIPEDFLSKIDELFPSSSEEIQLFVQNTQEKTEETIETILSLSDEERTFANVLKPWNDLASSLISKFSILFHIAQSESPASLDATIALVEMQGFVYEKILQNYDLYATITASIENSLQAEQVTAFESHIMDFILKTCSQLKDTLSSEEQARLDSIQSAVDKQKKEPFLYIKGDASDKSISDGSLSVLTINACLLPDNLSLFAGGVAPWEARIAPLAERIKASNADVVCLQEVIAIDGGFSLYELLKDQYAHFYILIGPRPLGFSFEKAGAPSGHFIASKYPIVNPQFSLYSVAGFPANWGVFDFTVVGPEKPLAHIYNTHLQSFDQSHFAQMRAVQLQEIIDKMEIDFQAQGSSLPYILCGDLNISLGSQEPAESVVKSYFVDAFNQEPKEINEENYTCTDFFTKYFLSKGNTEEIAPSFQILDYVLLLRELPSMQGVNISEGFSTETSLFPLHDLQNPQEALSDHHGLLTRVFSTQ